MQQSDVRGLRRRAVPRQQVLVVIVALVVVLGSSCSDAGGSDTKTAPSQAATTAPDPSASAVLPLGAGAGGVSFRPILGFLECPASAQPSAGGDTLILPAGPDGCVQLGPIAFAGSVLEGVQTWQSSSGIGLVVRPSDRPEVNAKLNECFVGEASCRPLGIAESGAMAVEADGVLLARFDVVARDLADDVMVIQNLDATNRSLLLAAVT